MLTQQPANKREAEGRCCCNAPMEFGVVALPSRRRGHHRLCTTSLFLSLSPGKLFAMDDDGDYDDNDDADDNVDADGNDG